MNQPQVKFTSFLIVDFDDKRGSVIPGAWRNDVPSDSWLDLESSVKRNSLQDVREEFKCFFMNEGAVPWQWGAAQVEH